MGNVEIPSWLEGLPLAPEFHPTDTEFADPIAYISKIEKQASGFGICKIIPPLPKPSKKYVLAKLNESLCKSSELVFDENCKDGSSFLSKIDGNDGEVRAKFTTRQQELGLNVKRSRGGSVNPPQMEMKKQMWRSGEYYTLEQFESKSKAFAKSVFGTVKEVSPLVAEAMFWRAASEKPIYVEYANDVPGSAFGEPKRQFRYFHKRRRRKRRSSVSESQESDDSKKKEVVIGEKSVSMASNDCSDPPLDMSKSCENSMSQVLEEFSKVSGEKSLNSSDEMEGTAGWILSNSPWNLQVIARSPGSLTRFMPDDIHGVTSPMVYIGMLFSWFAWHVEDHELHSLNFLHTGSPKTWYAVPGDYAFSFEEAVHSQAYGGKIDYLATLTLLGEKTTLLSPEVVVASGIPCCRLVQSPGEFVVTFPRAYHVGFSHGFNCGEAANFGTSQWLKIAKEAAVRRAAMGILPMLSHQQLLYLLTMSFISSVPRSLLPGARTSRLRDRLKEEREQLVKKVFIEDFLKENSILSSLVQKASTYRAVLWDPDLLPSVNEECDKQKEKDTNVTSPIHCKNAKDCKNLIDEMHQFMEMVNGLFWDDDISTCDFQVDSGTSACVACGILGFPFMSVIQPSGKASVEILAAESLLVQGGGVSMPVSSHFPKELKGSDLFAPSEFNGPSPVAEGPNYVVSQTCIKGGETSGVPFDLSSISKSDTQDSATNDHSAVCKSSVSQDDSSILSTIRINEQWNTSTEFLRPRIFCLEHAIQVEKLLQSKGGANLLIICHSDFKKIKAHVAAIAESLGTPFRYNEVPLETASQVDINLIDLANDFEKQDECKEDWTSKLGINLEYCVKGRKASPPRCIQHALALNGLLSDIVPTSESSNLKWCSQRPRSKCKHGQTLRFKQGGSIQMLKNEVSGGNLDTSMVGKEVKLLQYSRRRKGKRSAFGANMRDRDAKGHSEEASAANCGHPIESGGIAEIDHNGIENIDVDVAGSGHSSLTRTSKVEHNVLDHIGTKYLTEISVPAQGSCSSYAVAKFAEPVEAEMQNKASFSGPSNNLEVRAEIKASIEYVETNNSSGSPVTSPISQVEQCEIEGEKNVSKGIKMDTEVSNAEIGNNCEESGDIHVDINSSINKNEDLVDHMASSHVAGSAAGGSNAEMDKNVKESCMEVEICDCLTINNDLPQEFHALNGNNREGPDINDVRSVNHQTAAMAVDESSELLKENPSVDDVCSGGEFCSAMEDRKLEDVDTMAEPKTAKRKESKRKKEVELETEPENNFSGFIRSPCEGLRSRARKDTTDGSSISKPTEKRTSKKPRKHSIDSTPCNERETSTKVSYRCNIEGCRMRFKSKAELRLHLTNKCHHEGCGKRFSSHKYAVLHQRVHEDDRPLKCPWKGCTMSFKWAWARTEHERVHTGERPYECKVKGCGRTFRFISDYSRHRRRTGHYVNSQPPEEK
ncbi:JmjN domain [Dillenia turbinata]|uniref:JmjN domain n=1 Tax=Dillenia turbinata TaxID=194707 RepID=A0AAN8Z8Y6_9MAGN